MINLDVLLKQVNFLTEHGQSLSPEDYVEWMGIIRENFEWLWGVAFGD